MSYDFKNVKILLVEDNRQMLRLIQSVLLSFGVGNVITSIDGEEAFGKFCETNPDIVLTDWMMTPVDGIELSHKIRNDKDSPNPFVPILLMTGFSETKRVLESRDEGVTEFLVKPFNARDLYKRLHRIIEQPRQFVRSEHFFGPDRRRKRKLSTDGSNHSRRVNDDKAVEANPDTIYEIDI